MTRVTPAWSSPQTPPADACAHVLSLSDIPWDTPDDEADEDDDEDDDEDEDEDEDEEEEPEWIVGPAGFRP